jgi:hypothetical protein
MKRQTHKIASCEGKREFNSYQDAQSFINTRFTRPHRKRTKPPLSAYKCHHCQYFHVGNNRARQNRGWGYKKRLAASSEPVNDWSDSEFLEVA